MNYRGSYRHLLNNATSAILAAVEIYNKPRIAYRNECVVILLLNAWELLLKALLSKNGKSIFYPKERKKSYRTVSLTDALARAQKDFPTSIPMLPVQRNVELLETYRNNAVHFYNAQIRAPSEGLRPGAHRPSLSGRSMQSIEAISRTRSQHSAAPLFPRSDAPERLPSASNFSRKQQQRATARSIFFRPNPVRSSAPADWENYSSKRHRTDSTALLTSLRTTSPTA